MKLREPKGLNQMITTYSREEFEVPGEISAHDADCVSGGSWLHDIAVGVGAVVLLGPVVGGLVAVTLATERTAE